MGSFITHCPRCSELMRLPADPAPHSGGLCPKCLERPARPSDEHLRPGYEGPKAVEAETGLEDLTKAELTEKAEALGVSVPSKATKADIVDAIEEAD